MVISSITERLWTIVCISVPYVWHISVVTVTITDISTARTFGLVKLDSDGTYVCVAAVGGF